MIARQPPPAAEADSRRSPSGAPRWSPPASWALAFFLALASTHLASGLAGPDPVEGVFLFELAAIAIYGGLSVVALARRPSDPGARALFATAIVVSLTIVMPVRRLVEIGGGGGRLLEALGWLPFLAGFPAFVQLAALVPKRHPLADRPAFLRVHVLLGIALWSACALLLAGGDFGFGPGAERVRAALPRVNVIAYGWAALWIVGLLADASRRAAAGFERRQAVAVLAGVVPWSAFMVASALAPGSLATLPRRALIEAIAVLLVPLAFSIAILGFRLFDLGILVRRSVIFALTGGAVVGLVFFAVVGAGRLAGGRATPGPWALALLLVGAGALFHPLLRSVATVHDRWFFPEKHALERLERALIPELAARGDTDGIAAHLAHRLREALNVSLAVVLIEDEEAGIYRTRGVALTPASELPPPAVVLETAALESWAPARLGRPFRRTDPEARGLRPPPQIAAALAPLEVETVVPICLNEQRVGLVLLGRPLAGSPIDREDLGRLEVIAQAGAALLENARLFDLATRDSLTGLPRRSVFEQQLAVELERCRRHYRPFAIGLADLDDFKLVNDERGHLAGDGVLREAARRLALDRRSVDLVCRYGGEEFGLLLLDSDAAGARTLGERLVRNLAELPMSVEGGRPLRLTVSVGLVAVGERDLDQSAEALLRRADAALYRAKRSGKNRVEIDAGEGDAPPAPPSA
ncbi:MAG: diguanylate cyclase [Thermoanaerobaculia bacterium]|nr:MAG: diguanylate cyclase [Thermoanaerobaculia bacterium]